MIIQRIEEENYYYSVHLWNFAYANNPIDSPPIVNGAAAVIVQALQCDQSTPRPESVKMLLQSISLFFSYLLFSSVQSCSTVSESGGILTGVCPNDTFTVPIGKVLDYKCTATYTGTFVLYWNISGVPVDSFASSKPFGISNIKITNSGTKSTTLTIMAITTDTVLDIQCGLCNTSITGINCISDPKEFVGTGSIRLITFGKN